MDRRVTWDVYFLQICDAVAVRADCTRRQIGAVVVDASSKHIISTGYNGAAPGAPGCLSDGACPRGRHYKSMNYGTLDYGYHCATCRTPWPCAVSVPSGSSYDTGQGTCIALHAEQNACLRAGTQTRGAWIYVSDEPCDGCMRLITGAGFARAVWPGGGWTAQQPKRTLMVWLSRRLQVRSVR